MFARMLSRVPAVFAAAVLSLALPVGGQASAASGTPLVVEGRVTVAGGVRLAIRAELQPILAADEADRLVLAGRWEPEAADVDRSGEDGRYRLTAPGAGMWRLVLTAPGRIPLQRDFEPLLGRRVLPAIELPEDAGLEVTVRDAAGAPVAGAVVVFAGNGSGLWRATRQGWTVVPRRAFADAAGRVRLPRLPREGGTVRAWAPGHPVTPAIDVPVESGTLALSLGDGVQRTVAARFPDGTPAAGAVVRHRELGVPLGVTGEDGRFALALANDGGAAVELELDGGGAWQGTAHFDRLSQADGGSSAAGSAAADPAAAGSAAVSPAIAVLAPPQGVAGRVTDAFSGDPVAAAFVWRHGAAGGAVRSAADGTFQLFVAATGGEAAADEIVAAARGYRPQRLHLGRNGRLALALQPEPVLRGRLLDADDRPVPDALVRVREDDGRGLDWAIADERSGVRSDADGRFRVDDVAVDTVYDLRVEADGFALLERSLQPPADEVFHLSRGGRVRGTLSSAYGEPLPGVEVRMFPEPRDGRGLDLTFLDGLRVSDFKARTDAEGQFTVTAIPTGLYDLGVDAVAGHAPLDRFGIEVADGERVDLGRLVLDLETVIRGRVVDGAGDSVAGAAVSVDPASRYRSLRLSVVNNHSTRPRTEGDAAAVTGRDGRFELPGPAAGDTVTLLIDHPSYRPQRAEGVTGDGEPLEVVLTSGVRVSGTVRGPGGSPVPGAQVSVHVESDVETSGGRVRSAFGHRAVTGAEGGFDLPGLTPGTVTVEVAADGFSGTTLEPAETVDGDAVGPLDIVLEAGGTSVEGTVVDAGGEAVPGARVEAQGGHGTSSATCDAAGRFRLAGLVPGPLTLRASTPAGRAMVERAEAEVVVGRDTEPVTLHLQPVPLLAGRVVDSAGAPVPFASVEATWRGADGERGGQTSSGDSTGAFSLAEPPPGDYRLQARTDRPFGAELQGDLAVEVGERPPQDLEIVVRPAATVHGRVLGIGAAEHRRMHVVAAASDDSGHASRTGWVDADGGFRIGGLAVGAWTVTAYSARGPRASEPVEIERPGEEVEVELDLDRGDATTSVAGRVTVDERSLAAGGVRLLPVDGGGAERWVTTRYDGSFFIDGLEAGSYWVAVSGDFAAPAAVRQVHLEGAERLDLDLDAVAVSGRVVAADGSPVAGARVTLGPPGTNSRQTAVETDAAGAFRVPAVLAGSYELRATAQPGTASQGLTVGALDVGGVVLVLE